VATRSAELPCCSSTSASRGEGRALRAQTASAGLTGLGAKGLRFLGKGPYRVSCAREPKPSIDLAEWQGSGLAPLLAAHCPKAPTLRMSSVDQPCLVHQQCSKPAAAADCRGSCTGCHRLGKGCQQAAGLRARTQRRSARGQHAALQGGRTSKLVPSEVNLDLAFCCGERPWGRGPPQEGIQREAEDGPLVLRHRVVPVLVQKHVRVVRHLHPKPHQPPSHTVQHPAQGYGTPDPVPFRMTGAADPYGNNHRKWPICGPRRRLRPMLRGACAQAAWRQVRAGPSTPCQHSGRL